MGRYSKSGSSGDPSLKWVGLWIVWLIFFLAILPTIMCNGDVGCANVQTSNLLYLWWFVLTFGGAVPYLDTIFGIWAFLLILGCWDMS